MESRNLIGKVENKCQGLEKSNQCLIKLIEAWPLKINDSENCSQNRKKAKIAESHIRNRRFKCESSYQEINTWYPGYIKVCCLTFRHIKFIASLCFFKPMHPPSLWSPLVRFFFLTVRIKGALKQNEESSNVLITPKCLPFQLQCKQRACVQIAKHKVGMLKIAMAWKVKHTLECS